MANNYTETSFAFDIKKDHAPIVLEAIGLIQEMPAKLMKAVSVELDDNGLSKLSPAERIAVFSVQDSHELEEVIEIYNDYNGAIPEDEVFEFSLGFSYEIEDSRSERDTGLRRIWICHDESIDLDLASNFTQAILNEFDMDKVVVISAAFTCSKPRVDEFGGITIVVTKDRIEVSPCQQMVSAEYEAAKENVEYHVVEFTELNSGYEYNDKFILKSDKNEDAYQVAKNILLTWRGDDEQVTVDEDLGLVWYQDGLAAKLHFSMAKITPLEYSIMKNHLTTLV